MRKPQSLAHFLGVGNLFLIVIPLLIAGAWSLVSLDQAVRRSLADVNQAYATVVAGRLEEFFERPKESLRTIEAMLSNPELFPRDRLNEYLAEELEADQFLDQIQIIASDGTIRWMAPFNQDLIGVSRRGEEVYEGVRSSEEVYWSPSYISSKHERVAVTFGSCFGDYTILCDLDLGVVGRFSNSEMLSWNAPFQVRITDTRGVFVSHPITRKVRSRDRQTDFLKIQTAADSRIPLPIREQGGDFLVSIARVAASPDWYVLLLYPSAGLILTFLGYYLGFAIIIGLSVLASFFFSSFRIRGLRASLARLSDQTDHIASGIYEDLEDFGGGFIELRKLGCSFDSMIAGIRRREDTLLDRERGFREILENIKLIALGVDTQGAVVFANPAFLQLTGYGWEDVAGKGLSLFTPDDIRVEDSSFWRVIDGRAVEGTEESLLRLRDGSFRLIEWTITASRDASGARSGATGLGTDVTENRRQRELIESSLKEKEVLLGEMHHRVKNNLQLITSLLSLQSDDLGNEAVSRALSEAQARIRSISLIHETLYASRDFGDVEFANYVERLATELLAPNAGFDAQLQLELTPLRLTLTEAIPCGLVLSEILTNVRKYAFPQEWDGERMVRINLSLGTPGWAFLVVRDSGVGLKPDFSIQDTQSFGYTIIKLLASQLGGALDVRGGPGVTVTLHFPLGASPPALPSSEMP